MCTLTFDLFRLLRCATTCQYYHIVSIAKYLYINNNFTHAWQCTVRQTHYLIISILGPIYRQFHCVSLSMLHSFATMELIRTVCMNCVLASIRVCQLLSSFSFHCPFFCFLLPLTTLMGRAQVCAVCMTILSRAFSTLGAIALKCGSIPSQASSSAQAKLWAAQLIKIN